LGTITISKASGTCSADPTVTAASNNGSVSSTSIPVQCASGVSSIRDNCSWDNGSGSGSGASGGYGFVWAKSSDTTTPTVGGTNCSNYKLGNSIALSTAFNYTIAGLQANTSYTIRPYAKNGHGYGYGTAYTVTTLQSYAITYNNNGGSGSMAADHKDHGVSFTLPSNAGDMTKTGHHIADWKLGSSSGTSYSLGGSYTTNAAATFYAGWAANTYTVTYDKNGGGTGTGTDDQGFTYGVAQNLRACGFTAPTDKYFIGWNTDKNATTALYTDGESVSNLTTTHEGTVTLYAIWKDYNYTNYRTLCCTQMGTINNSITLTQGGNSVTISGWTYNDASSTKPAESNLASYTVRLYKKNGASWDLVSGTATGGSAGTAGTRTGIATNSKSVTFTGLVVESEYKFTIEGIGAAGYCDIAETAITSINSTDVSSTPFKFRYSIYLDDGTNNNYTHHYIEPTGNTDEGSVSITLSGPVDYYQFKISNGGFTGWWGQTGDSKYTTGGTQWTLDGSNNVKMQTWIGGTYTFTVDYSGTTNPKVTITYPSANQDAGNIVYWDASIVANWDHLHFRVGTDGDANASSDCKVSGNIVPGTDNFYKVTTAAFTGMRVWAIANKEGWTGANTNGVYKTKTGDGHAITLSSEYQDYVVGSGGVTLIPYGSGTMGSQSHDNNCRFYSVTKTDGMLTHNVAVETAAHGTLLVTYTNTSNVSGQTVAEGNDADLAHRCILTITATPDEGYTCASLTVNSSDFTSGNTHILSADAIVEATFTAKTYNISLDREGATTGSESVTMTYNSAEHTSITAPSRDGYTFGGWWSEDNGTGSMVMNTSGVLQANVTGYTGDGGIWTKDAICTLYAKWTVIPYTITYNLNGGTQQVDPAPATSYNIESGAITLPTPTKEGYDFAGWFANSDLETGGVQTTIAAGSMGNKEYWAKWTIKHYTITWLNNGVNYVTPVDYTHGSELALPAGTPTAPPGCSSKTFIGWTAHEEITSETSDRPTIISAGGAVNADATYRAVFADVTGYPDHFKRVTQISDISEGSQIAFGFYVTSNIKLCGLNFSGWTTYSCATEVTEESNRIPKPTAADTWNVSKSGSYWVFTNAGDGTTKLGLGTTSSNNNLDPDDYSYYKWEIGASTSGTNHFYVRLYDGSAMTNCALELYESNWKIYAPSTGSNPKTYTYASNSYTALKLYVPAGNIDNYITLCSSCTTPSTVEASDITSTSATITWDGVSQTQQVGGSGTGFTVLWGTDAIRANNSNSTHVAAGTYTTDLSGLAPATRYYVWVQSECNDEWSSSTNFYTNAKISYAANGGSGDPMPAKEVVYNAASTVVDACTFTAPSGKTFNGWVSDQAVTVGGGSTTSVPDGATISNLTKAITLTAQWRDLNTWTINFHADNGTVTGGTAQTATETEIFTFPNVTSTTCGKFIGWITSSSYNSATKPASFKAAGAEEEISLGGSPAATDYYAVYAEITDPTPTDDYVKVECEQDDWEGDYLIVSEYTISSTDYVKVFNGGLETLDASGNNVGDVTITSKTITSNNTTNGYKFIVSAVDGQAGKFYVKSASGYYIGNSGTGNALASNTTASSPYYNTIEYDDTNNRIKIKGNNASPTQLAYNSATGASNNRFRYYSAPDSQKDIQLYKKGGCQTVTYKTSPACSPTLQINAIGLTTMSYVYNAGPSASQTFTAGGKNMTEGKTITVTAPTNFQVSKDNSSFSGSVSYPVPASGEVSETIYIRLVGGLNVGSYGGTGQVITVSTNQDAVDNVTSGDVNGSVTKAAASMAFTPNTYEATYEGSPVIINFTFSLTGDGTVAFSRSPAANSRAVETDGEHTFTALAAGEWTITAVHTPGDNYSKASNATATVRVKCVDTYVDFIHNKTIKAYGSGSTVVDGKMSDWGSGYTVPYIDDNATETSGSCQQTHFKFMGWVVEDEINIADGTFKTGWTLIEAGTASKTATTKTYYAVWAKLED
jgi:uncharacterized repeat protein (TIGR02543 family)